MVMSLSIVSFQIMLRADH